MRADAAAGKHEAVSFGGMHEKVDLRRRDFPDQCTEGVAEAVAIFGLALIHARDVPAELHAARSAVITVGIAETNERT